MIRKTILALSILALAYVGAVAGEFPSPDESPTAAQLFAGPLISIANRIIAVATGNYYYTHTIVGGWVCYAPNGTTVAASAGGSTSSMLQECINAMQSSKNGGLRAYCPTSIQIVASTQISVGPAYAYLYDLRGCAMTSTSASGTAFDFDTLAQGTRFDWSGGVLHCQIVTTLNNCFAIIPSSADPVNGGKVTNQATIHLPYVVTDAAGCSSGGIAAIVQMNPNGGAATAIVNNIITIDGIDGNAVLHCAATGFQMTAPSTALNGLGENVINIPLVANYTTRGIDVGGGVAVSHSTQPLADNEYHVGVNNGIAGATDMIRTSGFREQWFITTLSVNAGTVTNCVNLVGGGTQTTPTGASDNTFFSNQIDSTSGCTNPWVNFATTFRNSVISAATPWFTYTPSVSCGAGAIATLGTVSGRYAITSKMLSYNINIPITAIGTCANNLSIGLPFNAVAQTSANGREDAASGLTLGGRVAAGSSTLIMQPYNNVCTNGAGACVSGSQWDVSGQYELQ